MRSTLVAWLGLALLLGCGSGEQVPSLGDALVFSGVDVLDGTGAPVRENQTVVISQGRIQAVGDTGSVPVPEGAELLELAGHTLIPGIISMHSHTHMPGIPFLGEVGARLNLAHGVTTIQTAGSASPMAELELAGAIDRGEVPGPRIFASSQYFTGPGGSTAMEQPGSTEEARESVRRWASLGVASIKIYRHIDGEIADAILSEAHEQGLEVTGHLCSLTYREAAAMGIDRIEHGLISVSDFAQNKEPGECPSGTTAQLATLDLDAPVVSELIEFLVEQKVTLTSTLAITESHFPHRPQGEDRALRYLAAEQRAAYDERQARLKETADRTSFTPEVLARLWRFERMIVEAGGLLVAGPDTGRHVLPGIGDQRNYELLQEAGFDRAEALQILTLNGAVALGIAEQVGSIEPGKKADLVLLRGEATTVREIVTVWKGGEAYDPGQLLVGLEGGVGAEPADSSP